MSYHSMSYPITAYHVLSQHIMPYHHILCYKISSSIIAITAYHALSQHIMSHHSISFHMTAYHAKSHRIMPYHSISCQITPYHAISQHIMISQFIAVVTKTELCPLISVLVKSLMLKLPLATLVNVPQFQPGYQLRSLITTLVLSLLESYIMQFLKPLSLTSSKGRFLWKCCFFWTGLLIWNLKSWGYCFWIRLQRSGLAYFVRMISLLNTVFSGSRFIIYRTFTCSFYWFGWLCLWLQPLHGKK